VAVEDNERSTYPGWIYKPIMAYAMMKGTCKALAFAIGEMFK
jgi:hypothetical protein